MALNILGDQIDALVDMTIVYPDGVPGYSEFWLGEVPRIAVNLRKIDIPDWVLGGNYEDDAEYRERFQQWVHELWLEKDQLIESHATKICCPDGLTISGEAMKKSEEACNQILIFIPCVKIHGDGKLPWFMTCF